MAGPEKRRGCLGCSFPLLVVIGVIIFGILILGLLSGPIGQGLLARFGITISLPSWLVSEKPAIHLAAPAVFSIGGFNITNTMIAGWITVVFLVLVSWLITRRMKLVPPARPGRL